MSKTVNSSTTAADMLDATGVCGDGRHILPGIDPHTRHAQGRCGYGPRLPMLVISPWARHNHVDHQVLDQTSVLRFVEDNWLRGERTGAGSFDNIANPIDGMFDFVRPKNTGKYILDPSLGTVVEDAHNGW